MTAYNINAARATIADLGALATDGIALPMSAKGDWTHYTTNLGQVRLGRTKRGGKIECLNLNERDFQRLIAANVIARA